jgi:hypothetical protein
VQMIRRYSVPSRVRRSVLTATVAALGLCLGTLVQGTALDPTLFVLAGFGLVAGFSAMWSP